MTHTQQHVIIHKIQELAAKYPKTTACVKYLAVFALGAWIF